MFENGGCEEVWSSIFWAQRRGKREHQMKGCVAEQKVSDWQMNAWTLSSFNACEELDHLIILYPLSPALMSIGGLDIVNPITTVAPPLGPSADNLHAAANVVPNSSATFDSNLSCQKIQACTTYQVRNT